MTTIDLSELAVDLNFHFLDVTSRTILLDVLDVYLLSNYLTHMRLALSTYGDILQHFRA